MGCGSSSPAAAQQPTTPAAVKAADPAPTRAAPAPAPAKAPSAAAPTPSATPANGQATPAAATPAPSAGAPAPAPSGGGGEAADGGKSDFQKAFDDMQKVPERMHDQVIRMLGSSDSTVDNLLFMARIVNMQCLVRSFLARRRVARIKREMNEGPSDFAKAMEELEKLPPRIANEVRGQMQKSDRPLHVLVKWAAIIIAQTLVRGYIARKRVARKRQDAGPSRTPTGGA